MSIGDHIRPRHWLNVGRDHVGQSPSVTSPASARGRAHPASERPTRTSSRKAILLATAERLASEAGKWRRRNEYFHEEDARYMQFLVPPGLRVLELGCGTGSLLDRLQPNEGIGVDFSAAMIEIARTRYPHLNFQVGDVEDESVIDRLAGAPFDAIVLSDTIGSLEDIQNTFAQLHRLCSPDTRMVVAYHSGLWYPILLLAELCRLKMPALSENSLSTDDISAILALSGFEEVKREWRQLLPKRWLGLGPLVNRFLATLPLVRRLCLRNYMVLRSVRVIVPSSPSATIVIPCRNERGNIEAAVRRIPKFATNQEIIFVEGHSKDGTLDEIHRVMAGHPNLDIKAAVQDGRGKGDAVRKGFDLARGDILMILDADLTMPPEDLPKFYEIMTSGRGEFVNGSRLVYPMEEQAMRLLNLVANRIFAYSFSYLLNQRLTDTLCGTKVLHKRHYRRIVADRAYFGDFDPFGDFDLIFGAAKSNLKFVEVPIRYMARTFGETQISRFRHGWLLLRMVVFAWWKLKAI
jgi:SAM-dependent methyltransferase